jgi:O-antigen ligase
MDFTFSNVLIFLLAISFGSTFSRRWRKYRLLYIALWLIILILSLERMAMIMTMAGTGVIYLLKSSKAKRKKVIIAGSIAATLFLVGLNLAEPVLKDTGAHKLIRLAELANPLGAASIADRMERKWEPTLNTIAANPLGVGIGYGSQTLANKSASNAKLLVEPHNELLQKTLETGVMGGLIFLILLVLVFRDGLRLGRFDGPLARFGYGFAAGTVAFWLCGIVNVPLSGSSGLLYWTLAGAVAGTLHSGSINRSHCTKIEQPAADTIGIASPEGGKARSTVKKGS